MGGRGSGGTRNTESFENQLKNFQAELEKRQYGSSTKLVPDKQQKEFRRAKREVSDWLKNNPDQDTVILAGGFRAGADNPEEYVHTAAKLNSYQQLVRSEARNTLTDLSLGVINQNEAQLELRALKSLDKIIQERRKML